MSPHLAVLAAYSVLLIAVGWYVSRRGRSAESFFVAGRRLPARLIFATVLAANIGAGSTIGAAALGYEYGLAAFWWVGAAGVGTLLLAVWLGPRMWRVATEARLRTVGDFLELRYGVSVRIALTGLLLVATLFVLAAQLLAAGLLIEGAAGIPLPFAILAAAVVMTAYFAVGGLQSAASVNFVQLGVLLLGLGLAVPYALSAAGGAAGIRGSLGEGAFDIFGNASLAFGYTALLIPAFLVSPGILQKLFGARSETAVRRGLTAAGAVLLVFAAVPPLLGAAAAVLHPELASADAALPALLVESLPVWLGTFGVAALFSAEVSSADAVLFMLSTSLSRRCFPPLPAAGSRRPHRPAGGARGRGGFRPCRRRDRDPRAERDRFPHGLLLDPGRLALRAGGGRPPPLPAPAPRHPERRRGRGDRVPAGARGRGSPAAATRHRGLRGGGVSPPADRQALIPREGAAR